MLKSLQLIFGFYPRRIKRSFSALPWYRLTRKEFRKQAELSAVPFPLDEEEIGNNCGCRYGCGIFILKKI